MTTLKERIVADMKDAMRAKEAVRLESIRLLRAAIQRREVDERTELTEEEVLAVVEKMIKQGRDSIEQFDKGGRDDLVQKEAATLAVLETYLPEQLDDDKLAALIDQALTETDAQSIRDMGKVMGWLKPHVQGRADMGAVSASIKQKLSRLNLYFCRRPRASGPSKSENNVEHHAQQQKRDRLVCRRQHEGYVPE